MKRIICFFLLVIISLSIHFENTLASTNVGNSFPMQKDWSAIAKEALNAVVKIEHSGSVVSGIKLPGSLGSGFFVNDNIILTNYHVIKNAPMISIPSGRGGTERVQIVTILPYQGTKGYVGLVFPSICSPKNDLAFVMVDEKGKTLGPWK